MFASKIGAAFVRNTFVVSFICIVCMKIKCELKFQFNHEIFDHQNDKHNHFNSFTSKYFSNSLEFMGLLDDILNISESIV